MTETRAIRFYEFDGFRLDAKRRVLLREVVPVTLTARAVDLLLALIVARAKILEKEELIKLLWPDTIVEEGNLTVNVSSLRKALGESPNERRYIATVPGRGYRFVAAVREWEECAGQFRRALELNPHLAHAHIWYALYLTATGQFDEGEAEARMSLELDPLSLNHNAMTGWVLYFGRRYERASE